MSAVSQHIADSTEVTRTGHLHGWLVEYERPWWYAERAGQTLTAYSKAALLRMINRRVV